MIARCTYPSMDRWSKYGGRGIKVCERWRESYANFLNDMGRAPSPTHQLDRIDNDGDYDPDNCRWATGKEQSLNRSTTRLLTAFGRTMTITEWAKETGLKRLTIHMRIKRGATPEDALSPR